MSKAMEHIDRYTKEYMRRLLLQCTQTQRDLFNRMYGSVAYVRPEQLETAFNQLERTITENQEEGNTQCPKI